MADFLGNGISVTTYVEIQLNKQRLLPTDARPVVNPDLSTHAAVPQYYFCFMDVIDCDGLFIFYFLLEELGFSQATMHHACLDRKMIMDKNDDHKIYSSHIFNC